MAQTLALNGPNLYAQIWSVADLLRADFKPHEYGCVILLFTVLRRLDCVMAPIEDSPVLNASHESAEQKIKLSRLLNQLRHYGPFVPAIIAAQILSSAIAKIGLVKTSGPLSIVFGKNISLPTLMLLAFVALQDMRDSSTQEFEAEIKNFVGFEKRRNPENLFEVRLIGGIRRPFTDLDRLAEFLGEYSAEVTQDRASRSFNAAKRTVILGWVDPYLLRTAEFLATRSLEQSMHAICSRLCPQKQPRHAKDPAKVDSLTNTRERCLHEDGQAKPGAESFVEFVLKQLPEIRLLKNGMYSVLDGIIDRRDKFAHRCNAEELQSTLEFTPFQVAFVLLKFTEDAQHQS